MGVDESGDDGGNVDDGDAVSGSGSVSASSNGDDDGRMAREVSAGVGGGMIGGGTVCVVVSPVCVGIDGGRGGDLMGFLLYEMVELSHQ